MNDFEYEIKQADDSIEREDYRHAADILNSVLQEEPDHPDALWRIGLCWVELNEPEKAIKALLYSFSFDRKNSKAFEACGCAYFKQGNMETAKIYLEKAELMDPKSSSIERNLGVVYNQMGAFDKSYAAIQRSYKLNPLDYRTMYALASAHIYFGKYSKAEELVKQMLSMEIPDDFKILAEEIHRIIKIKLKS